MRSTGEVGGAGATVGGVDVGVEPGAWVGAMPDGFLVGEGVGGPSGVVGAEIPSVGAGDVGARASCGEGVEAGGWVGATPPDGDFVGEGVGTLGVVGGESRSSSYSEKVSSSVKSNENGPSVKVGALGVGTAGVGAVGDAGASVVVGTMTMIGVGATTAVGEGVGGTSGVVGGTGSSLAGAAVGAGDVGTSDSGLGVCTIEDGALLGEGVGTPRVVGGTGLAVGAGGVETSGEGVETGA